MGLYGKQAQTRRAANAKALEAFGTTVAAADSDTMYRTIHAGAGSAVFTIGYERRDGEGLMAALRDAGVHTLVDIRQRPFSRKADFRKKALQATCESAGVRYVGMPQLGSTDELRDQLKESGDFAAFARAFKRHVLRRGAGALEELARLAGEQSIALLCYERRHEECHRSVVAKILAERDGAEVVAIA